MSSFTLPAEAAAILVALGAGLLIGIERERSTKLAFARSGGASYFWRLAPGLVLLVASFWAWWLAR